MPTKIDVPYNGASVAPIITALEGIFDSFNKLFFDSALSKPTITLSQKRTKTAKTQGWCTEEKVWVQTRDGQDVARYYEINICPEHLNQPPEEVCGILLHEMVHLYNIANGIKDCGSNGQYHNTKFKKSAEEHGLIAEKDPNYGYAKTSLAQESIEFIKTLDLTAFVLYRDSMQTDATGSSSPQQKQSSTRKYICPICRTSIRATKEVNVICGNCKRPFKEDKPDNEPS